MNELEKTLFIPLIVRANESKRDDALFVDGMAIEILEGNKIDEGEYDGGTITAHGIIARTVFLDAKIGEILKADGPVTIVNIGCGLDTRSYRLCLPDRCKWYDVDLPEVIDLRKKYLTESDRRHFIEGSILESSWHGKIDANDRKVVMIIEGVLPYFAESDIASAFALLANGFPRATVLFDAVHSMFVGQGITSPFRWGIRSIGDIDKMGLRLRVTDDALTGDLCKSREDIPLRIMGLFKGMRSRSRIIEGTFY